LSGRNADPPLGSASSRGICSFFAYLSICCWFFVRLYAPIVNYLLREKEHSSLLELSPMPQESLRSSFSTFFQVFPFGFPSVETALYLSAGTAIRDVLGLQGGLGWSLLTFFGFFALQRIAVFSSPLWSLFSRSRSFAPYLTSGEMFRLLVWTSFLISSLTLFFESDPLPLHFSFSQ